MRVLATLLLSLGLAAQAHVQPGMHLFSDEECRDGQPFLSYHIHTLFWQNNANSTNAALALQDEFAKHFGIYGNEPCPFEPGPPMPEYREICLFGVDYTPAGPFVTAQTASFIPVEYFTETVSWMMQHRGALDIFVHPNSGCSLQDHVHHGLWGGNKWEDYDLVYHPPHLLQNVSKMNNL